MTYLIVLWLGFVQNVSFSLVSRSRNRDHMQYHIWAATASNAVWFICMRELVKSELAIDLLIPYVVGTVSGSVYGMKIAMWFEKRLGASADGHLKKDSTTQ